LKRNKGTNKTGEIITAFDNLHFVTDRRDDETWEDQNDDGNTNIHVEIRWSKPY